MIPALPVLLNVVFILTTLLCLFLFVRAMNNSRKAMIAFVVIMLLQGLISFTGFYTALNVVPPRFLFLLLPSLILLIVFLFSATGKVFMKSLSLKKLHWIHVVRLPVELILHWLYLEKQVPRAMTYDGFNYDIISGLSAPLIIAFAFRKNGYNRPALIIWNIFCLTLLVNIVSIAIVSAESPFQQIAFTQPNRAVLFFPFVWLPSCIVPVVLFAHCASLYKLFTQNSHQSKTT